MINIKDFGIKIIKIDGESGKIELETPEGRKRRGSHFIWKSRKRGMDFVNKFILDKVVPYTRHISTEHHINWDRMWAEWEIGTIPLGIEYLYTCTRIPGVVASLRSEALVDFEKAEIFVKFGLCLGVPRSRQIFELDTKMIHDFLLHGSCVGEPFLYGNWRNKIMPPRFVRLGELPISFLETPLVRDWLCAKEGLSRHEPKNHSS